MSFLLRSSLLRIVLFWPRVVRHRYSEVFSACGSCWLRLWRWWWAMKLLLTDLLGYFIIIIVISKRGRRWRRSRWWWWWWLENFSLRLFRAFWEPTISSLTLRQRYLCVLLVLKMVVICYVDGGWMMPCRWSLLLCAAPPWCGCRFETWLASELVRFVLIVVQESHRQSGISIIFSVLCKAEEESRGSIRQFVNRGILVSGKGGNVLLRYCEIIIAMMEQMTFDVLCAFK